MHWCPHFGLAEGDLTAHFDALAERVQRWAHWFRDELRKGRGEAELIPEFARYEANDILDSGAAPGRVADYELAQYQHNRTGEDNADAHLKRQIMGREVVVAITKGALDLGPWEQIFYGEFDGRRRKRVLVKIIGE